MPKPRRSTKTTRKTISRLPRDGAGKGMFSSHEGGTDGRRKDVAAGGMAEFRGRGEFATHGGAVELRKRPQIRHLVAARDVVKSLASTGLALYPSQFTFCSKTTVVALSCREDISGEV